MQRGAGWHQFGNRNGWVRIRTLLDRDIDERSRTLARHRLRHVIDGLHPRIRWTSRGLRVADDDTTTVPHLVARAGI
ncbi:MAG TPA: hypothetical protein VEQ37_20650 [Actinomycetota bacterium]|nr:hypothetical protein [Actinomycetota bacterium]